MPVNRFQQFVHIHPTCGVERQPDALRFVAQNQAQKLARFDCFPRIHNFDRVFPRRYVPRDLNSYKCRSSRRKEAPYFVAALGQNFLEPPHVGYYCPKSFQ